MIDVRVDKADYKVSMEGNLETITAEFFILVRAVYKGVKQAGEIPAQLFKESVLGMIHVCFKEDAEIIKAIKEAEEILAMFPKEGNS